MHQRQDNPLNQSRNPRKRGQVAPGPVVQASEVDLLALVDRVAALETLTAAQALTIADHEARIAALEP